MSKFLRTLGWISIVAGALVVEEYIGSLVGVPIGAAIFMPIGCLLMGVAKVLDKLDIIVADNNEIQQDFEFIKDKLENE